MTVKKKTIITLILMIPTVYLGYHGYEMYKFAKGVQNDVKNRKNHFINANIFLDRINNGVWVHEKDSLATIVLIISLLLFFIL